MAKARAAKTYRDTSRIEMLLALNRRTFYFGGKLELDIVAQPASTTSNGRRNRQRPDEDNLVAACKSALDGLADALQVNDRYFHVRSVAVMPPDACPLELSRHGYVRVTISGGEDWRP